MDNSLPFATIEDDLMYKNPSASTEQYFVQARKIYTLDKCCLARVTETSILRYQKRFQISRK